MNMLVQPAPMPEEMDRGYLGRIMRINGCRSPKDMVDAMAAHFGEEGRTRREVTTHELLSRMAGMTPSPTEIDRQQTTPYCLPQRSLCCVSLCLAAEATFLARKQGLVWREMPGADASRPHCEE